MNVDLSDDEALVLLDLLHDYGSNDDGREIKVNHAAERNALWALSAQLEKRLVAPLPPNYAELLSQARARVEQQGGSW
ncbi:MAG TPA: hypothetical protein VJ860_18605 [Polyangia bacterium]|jgi:hypothetical protein|nr:hypothetical protein [Polyangia bacterium]